LHSRHGSLQFSWFLADNWIDMNIEEARRILDKASEDAAPTPEELKALDLVEAAEDAVLAMNKFRCPTCGAGLRQSCSGGTIPIVTGGTIHRRRLNKLELSAYRRGSVHSIPAGAPFTSRRRH